MPIIVEVMEGETVIKALRDEPVGSVEFTRAMDVFRRQYCVPEIYPGSDLYQTVARCFGSLYDHFGRDAREFAGLVAKFGECVAVRLFFGAIQIHDDGPVDDCLAVVNAFAFEHFATCERCAQKHRFLKSVSAVFANDKVAALLQ